MRRAAVALLLLSMLRPAGVEAMLCRTRAGALVVRPACTPKQRPVDVGVLGANGAKGDPGPAGASSPRLRVFDAQGRFVGHLSATGRVFFPSGELVVFAMVSANGFTQRGSLYFEGPSCGGAPLVFETPAAPQLVVHGSTGYLPAGTATPHPIQSTRFPTSAQSCMGAGQVYDVATGLCCAAFLDSEERFAPVATVDLSGFAPPFRLEVLR